MANLVEQLESDLKSATLSRDAIRLLVIRSLKSAMKNFQIDSGQELSPQQMLVIIQKEAKKRQDSIDAYNKAGRTDLVAEEQAELDVIKGYLPAELDEGELGIIIDKVIDQAGATSKADTGKVMKLAIEQVAGRASGGRISQMVAQRLK